MDFFAKKCLSALLLPVPIVALLLLLTLIGLLLSKVAATRWLLLLSMVTLLIFSFSTVPYLLLDHLESQFAVLKKLPANVNTIVVLGGGVRDNTTAPPNTQLSSASLARLIEAIRLYRQRPGSQIILSGGRVFGAPSEAHAMDNLAVALGVNPNDVTIENGSADTYHEALYLKKYFLKKHLQQPFALVTSASHMLRAMQLFKSQGMHPVAAPTQFLVKHNAHAPKNYLPNASNLVYADIAIHEYFGLWWSKWRKEIQ